MGKRKSFWRSIEVSDWLAIVGLLVLCGLAFALFGCSVSGHLGVDPPKPALEGRPASRPACQSGIDEWAARKAQELSIRFDVPIPRVELLDEAAPVQYAPMGVEACVLWGEYDRQAYLVRVWLKDPDGNPRPFREVKTVILHEMLHHMDRCKGGAPDYPGNHNEAFEKRIKDLRLCPEQDP